MVVAGAAQSQWLYIPYIVLCQRSKASGEVASDELASDNLASDDVDSGAIHFRRAKLLMTSSSGALSFRRF